MPNPAQQDDGEGVGPFQLAVDQVNVEAQSTKPSEEKGDG
jgi:hypothetical protein